MACEDCGGSKSSGKADRNALAERAMKLALALPDDVTCQKNFKKSEGAFLSALRNLAAGYALAHTWSESETRSRLESLKFTDAALGYAFGPDLAIGNGGGGEGLSCTATCEKEMKDCITACDDDSDAGYTCYFDCRLSFYACLSGCIFRNSGFGGFGGIA